MTCRCVCFVVEQSVLCVLVSGDVHCCAYVHATEKDVLGAAAEALKEDFARSIKGRFALLCDGWRDALDDEGTVDEQIQSIPILQGGELQMPQRVLLPFPGSRLKICDYMQV